MVTGVDENVDNAAGPDTGEKYSTEEVLSSKQVDSDSETQSQNVFPSQLRRSPSLSSVRSSPPLRFRSTLSSSTPEPPDFTQESSQREEFREISSSVEIGQSLPSNNGTAKTLSYEKSVRAKSVSPTGKLGKVVAVDSRNRLASHSATTRDLTNSNARVKVPWSDDELNALVAGIDKYGCRWARILVSPNFAQPLRLRTNVDLKDKFRNLIKSKKYSLEVKTRHRDI